MIMTIIIITIIQATALLDTILLTQSKRFNGNCNFAATRESRDEKVLNRCLEMTNMLPFGDLFDEIENDVAKIQKSQGPLQMFLRQEVRRSTMMKSFFKRAAASTPPHFFS